jgi:hypothetical protein
MDIKCIKSRRPAYEETDEIMWVAISPTYERGAKDDEQNQKEGTLIFL